MELVNLNQFTELEIILDFPLSYNIYIFICPCKMCSSELLSVPATLTQAILLPHQQLFMAFQLQQRCCLTHLHMRVRWSFNAFIKSSHFLMENHSMLSNTLRITATCHDLWAVARGGNILPCFPSLILSTFYAPKVLIKPQSTSNSVSSEGFTQAILSLTEALFLLTHIGAPSHSSGLM